MSEPKAPAVPMSWARCEKCGQKLVAEGDGDPYCLNCETCSYCHDVHHMGDVCQEATEAEAKLVELREALKSALLWLDGEYAGLSRENFNHKAWGRAARAALETK